MYCPLGESPTTRLVTLVGHSEYRPSSLSAKVALFKKGFSPHMIHNPDHVAGHLLEQGGEELLSRGGDAYFAVVFCTGRHLPPRVAYGYPGRYLRHGRRKSAWKR